MSAPTTPACPLGLTPGDLSAWRDQALATNEQQRITAHVATCPACQRTITAHKALTAALRAEQAPAPDPRNWPQVRARIAAERSKRAPARQAMRTPARLPHAPRPALWGGLGAVAAVLLISALFFHLFAQQASLRPNARHTEKTVKTAATPAPLASVAPTQPLAGTPLAWQTRMAPESVIPPPGNQTYTNGFAFSPADAQTAYICSTTNAIGAPIAIWATHDGAQTWTHVSDIPYVGQVAECDVTVDAADPLRLNVIVSEQNITTFVGGAYSYVSDDGGKTWRTLSDDVQLVGLETQNGATIAIVSPWDAVVNASGPQRPAQLSVSHDDWKTWQPIDGALSAQSLLLVKVWRRPGDGALLVEAATRVKPQTATATATSAEPFAVLTYSLWQSDDLGAHWSQFPTPANLNSTLGFTVAPPLGTDTWRVCGFAESGKEATHNGIVGCTLDGGQTWASRPLPALPAPCADGATNCLQLQIMRGDTSALLSDGSLVTTFYAGSADPNVVETPSMFHVFRLPAGSSQWQDLGSPPDGGLLVLGSPATGTLVSYSGASFADGASGQLVGQIGGDVPNRGALNFAALP